MSKHPHVDLASQYVTGVIDGDIDVCEFVKNAARRQRKDLASQQSDDFPYIFDPVAAERVCRFLELLPHVKGKWARNKERLHLQPWQCFLACTVFGWKRKADNLRRFREVYLEVPRKNGKSVFAAGIGAYMFMADGEYGAEVYSGATSEKQAWEVFRPARLMALRTEGLKEHFGVTVHATTLAKIADGSRFEPLIGNPGDGSSPHCAIIDEMHEHKRDDQYMTMLTGMGAREQPMMFIITTAGSDVAGPCYDKRGQVIKTLSGAQNNDELFGLIYTLDKDDDWTDPAMLRKANPNFGVSVGGEYLEARLKDALQSARRQSSYRTKHLNQWVGAKSAWLNLHEWQQAPKRKTLGELSAEGRQCFVGLDLASKVDVAAMLMVFPPVDSDPIWHVHGKYYVPERMAEDSHVNGSHYMGWAGQGMLTLTEGAIIDYDLIMDDLMELAGEILITEVAYDPWQATHLATKMAEEGLKMVEVRQIVQNFSEPMKEVESLIKSQKLAHGDCPILTWMAGNVVAQEDKKGNIYPNKEYRENKIDGIVSLIMAAGRAQRHQQDIESIYETRGMRTV